MDPVIGIILIAGTVVASLFNYILNRAPGSDPEDFQVGPQELGITCDCFLNTLIVGIIVGLAIAASSSIFASMEEFFVVLAAVFIIITIAGLFGRRRRYQEWNEMSRVFKRAVASRSGFYPGPVDVLFDDDEEE